MLCVQFSVCSCTMSQTPLLPLLAFYISYGIAGKIENERMDCWVRRFEITVLYILLFFIRALLFRTFLSSQMFMT